MLFWKFLKNHLRYGWVFGVWVRLGLGVKVWFWVTVRGKVNSVTTKVNLMEVLSKCNYHAPTCTYLISIVSNV